MLTNQLVEKFNISPPSPSPPSLFIILSSATTFCQLYFISQDSAKKAVEATVCVLGTERSLQGAELTQALGELEEDSSGTRHRSLPAIAKCCAAQELAGKLLSFLGVPGKSHQYLFCSSGAGGVQKFPGKFL